MLWKQTQGFLFGIGIAIAFGFLINRTPILNMEPVFPRWVEIFSVFCVVIALTYLNYRKAAQTWVDIVDSITDKMFRIPVVGWFRHTRGWIGWFENCSISVLVLHWLLSWHFILIILFPLFLRVG